MDEYRYDKSSQLWNDKTTISLEKTYFSLWADKSSYQYTMLPCVAKAIHEGDKVADIGCFTGHYLPKIRTFPGVKNFDYLGVDVTPVHIARAKQIHVKQPNATFEVGDIFNLKYLDKSFDLVVCSGVLIHLPEIIRPIKELARISRRDVILLVQSAEKTVDKPYNGFFNWHFSDADMTTAINGANLIVSKVVPARHSSSARSAGLKYKIYCCKKR